MQIEIIIKDDDGKLLAKRIALGFETAEEDLGKLERFMQREYNLLSDEE